MAWRQNSCFLSTYPCPCLLPIVALERVGVVVNVNSAAARSRETHARLSFPLEEMTTDSAVLCRCLDTVIELFLKLESRGAQAETAVVGVPRERNVGVHCFQNFATLFSFVPKKNWPPVFGPTPKGQDQFAPTYSQRHRQCVCRDGAMRRDASCARVAGDESDCARLA